MLCQKLKKKKLGSLCLQDLTFGFKIPIANADEFTRYRQSFAVEGSDAPVRVDQLQP
jgi:hypothetical protein